MEEDELGIRLSRRQLEILAHNHQVAAYLKDDVLRSLTREIDASPDAEQVLDISMTQPHFREFCDQVISALQGPPDQKQ